MAFRTIDEVSREYFPSKVVERLARALGRAMGTKPSYLESRDDPRKGSIVLTKPRWPIASGPELLEDLTRFYTAEGYTMTRDDPLRVSKEGSHYLVHVTDNPLFVRVLITDGYPFEHRPNDVQEQRSRCPRAQ